MTQVRFLQTFSIIGNYEPKQDVIELSSYLKQFPDLCSFILLHELTHADIHHKNKYSLKHILVDVKDRWKMANDNELWQQFRSFQKLTSTPIKERLFYVFVNTVGMLGSSLEFLVCWRGILFLREWVKRNWEILQ